MLVEARIPIPPTVLLVGMTGHGLNKLSPDKLPGIEKTIDGILAGLQTAGQEVVKANRILLGEGIRFVLNSSIAEGADRRPWPAPDRSQAP